jgi:hypothetical protein
MRRGHSRVLKAARPVDGGTVFCTSTWIRQVVWSPPSALFACQSVSHIHNDRDIGVDGGSRPTAGYLNYQVAMTPGNADQNVGIVHNEHAVLS